jgi:nucleoside-diphosphate-sugar epimerase
VVDTAPLINTRQEEQQMSGREPQVVVVTGASGGIGRATAHAFARRGGRVGLVARGREGLEEAAREVRSLGGQALVIPTDVADHEQVEAAAAAVEEQFGEIDAWVNDAMATVFAQLIDIEPEEFRRATEVTYLGAVYGTMAALKRMKARNRGTIVQVGSALSYVRFPSRPPTAARSSPSAASRCPTSASSTCRATQAARHRRQLGQPAISTRCARRLATAVRSRCPTRSDHAGHPETPPERLALTSAATALTLTAAGAVSGRPWLAAWWC